MNKVSLSLFFTMLLSVVFFSCQKDENKVYYYGGTAPVLTVVSSTSDDTVRISYENQNSTALIFNWTNPNYIFTTGISSQDVTYTLEIDTVGSNFTNPNVKKLSVSKDLSRTILQTDLNDIMLNQLVLKVGVPHSLQVRLKANLTNGSATLVSNVLKFVSTPYSIPPKVTPPGTAPNYTDGELFLVGDATAGGWNNPVPVPTQQFTQVSPTIYELTVTLTGGKEYLFIPKNGDWSHKYACKDKTLAGLSDGGDFGKDLNDNFPGPGATGTYKIQVDFQRGKFVVTKQ